MSTTFTGVSLYITDGFIASFSSLSIICSSIWVEYSSIWVNCSFSLFNEQEFIDCQKLGWIVAPHYCYSII